MSNNILDQLKEYFSKTSEKEINKEWKKIGKACKDVGIPVDDFMATLSLDQIERDYRDYVYRDERIRVAHYYYLDNNGMQYEDDFLANINWYNIRAAYNEAKKNK